MRTYTIPSSKESVFLAALNQKLHHTKSLTSSEKAVFWLKNVKEQPSGFYGAIEHNTFWIKYVENRLISVNIPSRYYHCKIIKEYDSIRIVGRWKFSRYWSRSAVIACFLWLIVVWSCNPVFGFPIWPVLGFLLLICLHFSLGALLHRSEERKVLHFIEELCELVK